MSVLATFQGYIYITKKHLYVTATAPFVLWTVVNEYVYIYYRKVMTAKTARHPPVLYVFVKVGRHQATNESLEALGKLCGKE